MINEILVSLKEYLKCMLPPDVNVVLDSIKKDKDSEGDDVVITLLRIEEETSRKAQNAFIKVKEGDQRQISPDLDFNLEVLISSPARRYETSLHLISEVIRILNSIKTVKKPEKMSEDRFKIIDSMIISLMGMSFDQMLSLWQTLGGTLVPAVAYKIRMITVKGLTDEGPADLVREGGVRVEMGRMESKDKELKSLTKKEKDEMAEAQKRKESQNGYAQQVAQQEKEKDGKDKDGESKRTIQIREK